MTTCRSHYEALHSEAGEVLSLSFSDDNAELMARAHAFTGDMQTWAEVLEDRSEVGVLEASVREYQWSVLALVTGQYRAAFAALRLSLELILATSQWGSNERELREWQLGQRDMNWNALTDIGNGVLSKSFIRLFTPTLADDVRIYLSSAIAVYRECSEYVHGNARTHEKVPTQLQFSEDLFKEWHQKCEVIRTVISYVLASRYLGRLSIESRDRLESTLTDHLGHVAGIRAILGLPIEGCND